MLIISIMMIALLVFLGLSACASLAIVSAVVLSARSQMPIEGAETDGTFLTGSPASAKAALVPAFSH
jgi:hypothetical protein